MMLNSFSTYYPYFKAVRGFTDSQISFLITVRSAAGILSLVFVNKYFEIFNIKKGMIIGLVICAISLVLYANATTFALLVTATFVAGIGIILASTFPATILINRWFIKSRGTALSICISGTGIATVFVPNLTVSVIEKYGLSAALYLSAAALAVLGIGSALFIYDYPEKKGLVPYGEGETIETKVKLNNQTNISIGSGLTVVILIAMALQGIASYETTQLFTMHYTNSGFTNEQSASALAVWGGVLTIAKLIYGPMADRFGIYKVTYFSLIFATAGIGLCCFAYTGQYFIIMLASVFIGISFPYNTIGVSLWASSLYKQEDYPKAYQRMNLANQVGVMAFSVVPGLIANKTGDYILSYAIFAVMVFVALVIVQIAFIKHDKLEKQSAAALQ